PRRRFEALAVSDRPWFVASFAVVWETRCSRRTGTGCLLLNELLSQPRERPLDTFARRLVADAQPVGQAVLVLASNDRVDHEVDVLANDASDPLANGRDLAFV